LATISDSRPDKSPIRSAWLRRRAILLLLILFAEIAAFSLAYDLANLKQSQVPLLRLAGHGTAIFRVAAVAAVVLLAIGRKGLRNTMRRWAALATDGVTFFWTLAGHAVAAGVFAVESHSIMRENGNEATAIGAWLWLSAAALALAFWLAALAPMRFWTGLYRPRRILTVGVSLLIGIAVHYVLLISHDRWFTLNDLTVHASEQLLRLVSNDFIYYPNIRVLGTSQFQVVIAPVCSGFEGIALVSIALGLFLILFRNELRFPHVLVIVPIGIAIVWCFNVLRIVSLIMIGAHISPAIALSGFHSQAGWIGFSLVTLLVAFAALRFPQFAKRATPRDGSAPPASTLSAAYLLPLLAMIAASMVAAAFTAGFDRLYPLKIFAGLAALACFIPVYRKLPQSCSWPAIVIGGIVFAVWLCFEQFSERDGTLLTDGLRHLSLAWAIVWLGCRVIGSSVVVPIVEELGFRGYLMRRITCADFNSISYQRASRFAVTLSSLLFGLLHGRWIAGTVAGILYALAARRRNMLCDAIVAHGVTNGLIAVYVLAFGYWRLWS
jgi:exosortase E/protease (VPEID-CTERM system)